jgi:predicted TPR repeat methyltransferase
LIFFGDLNTVLKAASHALRPGGWLAFTLEQTDDDDVTAKGYRLNANGRYSHKSTYISQKVQAAGLTLRAINAGVARQDGDQPVPGWVVLAQRDAIDVAV